MFQKEGRRTARRAAPRIISRARVCRVGLGIKQCRQDNLPLVQGLKLVKQCSTHWRRRGERPNAALFLANVKFDQSSKVDTLASAKTNFLANVKVDLKGRHFSNNSDF